MSTKLYFLSVLLLLLMACDGSGPELSYRGISAESASSIIVSNPESQALRQTVVRVRTDRQFGFDWEQFWTRLGEGDVLSQISAEDQEVLLSLYVEVCSAEHKEAFTELILNHPEHYQYLFQSDCPEVLPITLIDEMTSRLSGGFLRARTLQPQWDRYIADLSYHALQHHGPQQAAQVMNRLNEQEWRDFLNFLVAQQDSERLVMAVEAYQRTYSTMQFSRWIVLSLSQDATMMRAFIALYGYAPTLHLFSQLPLQMLREEDISADNWQSLLDLFVELYIGYVAASEGELGRVREIYQLHQRLLPLIHLSSFRLSIESILVYESRIFERIENQVASMAQKEALLGSLAPSDTLRLLEWRYSGLERREELVEEWGSSLLSLTESPLQEYQQKRWSLLLEQEPSVAAVRRQQLCQDLESNGLLPRVIEASEFRWEMTQQPGCLIFSDGQEGRTLSLSEENVRMSLGAVLVSRGTHLHLEAESFAGSIIDLSSEFVHENLPEEPTPSSYDAKALPVLFGLNVMDEDAPFLTGIHYLLFHYVWREAADGEETSVVPETGRPGGDLTLELEQAQAVLPKLVSLGGGGQTGTPSRAGGLPDESYYPMYRFEEALANTSNNTTDVYRVLFRPTVFSLQELIEFAERDEVGSIPLYVNHEVWWNGLPVEQKEKVSEFCQDSGLEGEACTHHLAQLSAQQMSARMAEVDEEEVSSVLLQQMGASRFELPGGALGPENASGSTGASGRLVLQVDGGEQ